MTKGFCMRRVDPEILKLYGLTEEDVMDPGKALLSAGVRKMFDVIRFMKLPVDLGSDGMGREQLPGYSPADAPPIWQSMTGLFPGSEVDMPPEKREEALQQLVEIVMRLLRYEWQLETTAPNRYHTVYWDPLPKICTRLSIARAELSRLSKEATGLAAHELVDI